MQDKILRVFKKRKLEEGMVSLYYIERRILIQEYYNKEIELDVLSFWSEVFR